MGFKKAGGGGVSLDDDDGFERISLNKVDPDEIVLQPKQPESKKKMTVFLFLCVLTVSSGAFQFGYNLSSLNPLTYTLKDFIRSKANFFVKYNHKVEALNAQLAELQLDNMTSLNDSNANLTASLTGNFFEKFIWSSFFTSVLTIKKNRGNRIVFG